jgi:hypothetical protein
MLDNELRALYMAGKCSTSKLHPQFYKYRFYLSVCLHIQILLQNQNAWKHLKFPDLNSNALNHACDILSVTLTSYLK